MGWVVTRNAVLYAQEYGWSGRFEGLCAEIVAQMIAAYDPARDRQGHTIQQSDPDDAPQV